MRCSDFVAVNSVSLRDDDSSLVIQKQATYKAVGEYGQNDRIERQESYQLPGSTTMKHSAPMGYCGWR